MEQALKDLSRRTKDYKTAWSTPYSDRLSVHCSRRSSRLETESKDMANIYGNSMLTIAAASAQNGDDGCFEER
jgi:hypothetical protein